jgi:hypothetical protein
MLKRMLVENTGRSVLDSGDYYGRHYEENQERDFDAEPAIVVDWYNHGAGQLEIVVQRNVYHYLQGVVVYEPALDAQFQEWLNEEEGGYLDAMKRWPQERRQQGFDIEEDWGTFNTYNGDCILSQTLQGLFYVEDDVAYVLLQVHGGCDVRGGYTRPRLFQSDPEEFFRYNDATIKPEPPPPPAQEHLPARWPEHDWTAEPYWETDDGYHWFYQGVAGYGAGKRLEDYESTPDPDERGRGKIYIEDYHTAYCPLTGRRLIAY